MSLDERKRFVRIENEELKTKLGGLRYTVIAGSVLFMMFDIAGICHEMRQANKLKEDELKIRKEQLELARRQFVLDSIAMTQNQKMQ